MSWDPSFYVIESQSDGRAFPFPIDESFEVLPLEPERLAALAGHLSNFSPSLSPIPPLPGRSTALLCHVLWDTPNGGMLEISLDANGTVGLDNHAGLDAILTLYRYMLLEEPRYAILDPMDGFFHNEASLLESVKERETKAAAFLARSPHLRPLR